jgi:hypothetical protein
MVKSDGFRRALKAAVDGPDLKNVEWTSFGHDFNVKKVVVTKTANGLTIDGSDGHHISHRKSFRPDDQIFYKCRVTPQGKVEDLEINIKTTAAILKEWFETAGEIISVVALIASAGKADQIDNAEPTPASVELLDGDWESDVDFMIANIISYVTAREMPEVANKPSPTPVFATQVVTVNPLLTDKFLSAKARLAGS